MNFDFTITFSLILAIIAFVSPIITTLINNSHNFKVKKLDMYEQYKRETLESFISSVSDIFLYKSDEHISKYYFAKSKLNICFLISDSDKAQLDTLTKSIDNYDNGDNFSSIEKVLNAITVSLSKQIQKK